MAKVLINFTVEEHIVMAFKTRVPARERSSAVENFMSAMSNAGECDTEENELEREIEEIRGQMHKMTAVLGEKYAVLEMKRKDRMKNEVIRRKELESMYDSIRAVNPLRD